MFEIINAFKKGYDVWKQTRFQQIITLMVLGLIGILILAPFAFFIAITADHAGAPFLADPNKFITGPLLRSLLTNPFWRSIFATVIVFGLLTSIIMGAIQKIAHDYAGKGARQSSEPIKTFIPMIIPLVIVAIVSGIIIGIPTLIMAEIFNKLHDPTLPVIFSFTFFQGTVILTRTDIIVMLVSILIYILLGGPYILAITAVVVDEAGINGLVEGWKLYFLKVWSTIVAMITLLIIGIILALVFYMPINGITEAAGDLSRLFLNIFLLLILGVIVGLTVITWLSTALYSFYQEIKE